MALSAMRADEVHGGGVHEITARTGRRNRDAVLTPDRPQPGCLGPVTAAWRPTLTGSRSCAYRAQDNGSASTPARVGSPACRSAISVGTLACVIRDVIGLRAR
jgi:hypothetical protein